MPRWIMVDDTDPGVKYTGNWVADKGSLDSSGNWGPPYMSTLHGIKTQGSFTYTFSGSAFTLTGAIQLPRSTSSSSTSWECVIDGASIPVDNPQYVENRVEFCAKFDLSDGPHTLQVNAKGTSSQTFWFDHLQYIPSASVSLADAAIMIDTSDPMWGFDTGWNSFYPGFMTNQTGAKVSFEFTGVSFKWYGFYDASFPFPVSSASYSIDGGSPVNFQLNGISAQQTIVQYSQVFFTTDPVSQGTHKAEVVYNGDTKTTPLTVEAVIVQNGEASTSIGSGGGASSSSVSGGAAVTTGSSTKPDTSGISTSTSTSTIGPASVGNPTSNGGSVVSTGATSISTGAITTDVASNGQTSNSSKSNTGAIVGGVVGGIVILLMFSALLFWFCRRRNQRKVDGVPANILPEPYFDHPLQREMFNPTSVTSGTGSYSSAPNDSSELSMYPPTTPLPFQSHSASTQGLLHPKTTEAQQFTTHIEPPRVIQDVDSGIRYGNDPNVVQILPPVYTQT